MKSAEKALKELHLLGIAHRDIRPETLHFDFENDRMYISDLTFAGFVDPICAAFYGWIFLGETITPYFILSTVLVFIGLYVFYMEELRQGYVTL